MTKKINGSAVMSNQTPILVTGAAGFIGAAVSQCLIDQGKQVVGIDNLNDYYDVQLKKDRLAALEQSGFRFEKLDLVDYQHLQGLFSEYGFKTVIHLAAQAGVRYSLENPQAYVDSNLTGFVNMLELCRHNSVEHLVFASSSSVYGANKTMPFSIKHNVDHPVSLYAATKKSNELLAHSYAHLYGLPCTGLRFFTVYGPWGRPDMAYFKFTKAILADQTIEVFNHGDMRRDFTYIDDIVDGVVKIADKPAQGNSHWNAKHPDPSSSYAPYQIYNIGNNKPVELMHFIEVLESCLGKKAKIKLLPMADGDVKETYADIDQLQIDVGFNPSVQIEQGLQRFVGWYQDYYKV